MYGIAVHGGAGTPPRGQIEPARERRYHEGMLAALDAAREVLERGGSSLDAVVRAVVVLEDDPMFNAGRGAVCTREGHHELDASIMEGAALRAGAVCGLRHVKNPIELARAVMERSPFVMLGGAGAEEFALAEGFALVPNEYFRTEERWQQLQRVLTAGDAPLPLAHVGTVGAVALDVHGHLAAATSTGGMTAKRYGRIGDSPVIGAGTYADDRACAVSATGHGEIFLRNAVAHDLCARMRYGGASLDQAVHDVVHGELVARGGEGGVIAIDRHGRIAIDCNVEGMFRGSLTAGGEPRTAIFREP
ncbi:MAG: isoaspartyl peptidase/L-asparaginase [Gammaproteobacteria bacterium]|nr:isoaspartyl peptidase/L-asparaginase [Gammaproteobacteria bacterium]